MNLYACLFSTVINHNADRRTCHEPVCVVRYCIMIMGPSQDLEGSSQEFDIRYDTSLYMSCIYNDSPTLELDEDNDLIN